MRVKRLLGKAPDTHLTAQMVAYPAHERIIDGENHTLTPQRTISVPPISDPKVAKPARLEQFRIRTTFTPGAHQIKFNIKGKISVFIGSLTGIVPEITLAFSAEGASLVLLGAIQSRRKKSLPKPRLWARRQVPSLATPPITIALEREGRSIQ